MMYTDFGNPSTVYGLHPGQLKWADDFTAAQDSKGKWTASQSFHCRRSSVVSLTPKLGSECPIEGFQFLGLDSCNVSHEGGDICKVTCKYAGSEDNREFSFESNEGRRTEMAISTSEEPIESHHKYAELSREQKNNIALLKSGQLEPSTGGKYVRVNGGGEIEFTGVALELAQKIERGITHYLAAHQIYRIIYVSRRKPNAALLNGVGKKSNPAGAPSLSGGRNWLFVGVSVTETGNSYQYSLEFRLSGPGGWDDDLYS